VTVLFVSHDLGLVKQLSDRAILLLGGKIEAEGEPKDVINRYIGLVLQKQKRDVGPSGSHEIQGSFRHGDGTSEILDIHLLNARGDSARAFASVERATVRVRSLFHHAKCGPMVCILIRTRTGMDVYGTNTGLEQVDLGDFTSGEELDVEFRFDCWLTPQEYTLTVATQNADGSSHDWVDEAIVFEVVDARSGAGVANLRAEVTWTKRKPERVSR
jgi:lipopolysaccharide transport system ATP-binding protein